MEILIEFIIECLLEGIWEVSKSNKAPTWFRIICSFLLIAIFFIIIVFIMFIAVLAMSDHIFIGMLLFLIAVLFLFMGIRKGKRIYRDKMNQRLS